MKDLINPDQGSVPELEALQKKVEEPCSGSHGCNCGAHKHTGKKKKKEHKDQRGNPNPPPTPQ